MAIAAIVPVANRSFDTRSASHHLDGRTVLDRYVDFVALNTTPQHASSVDAHDDCPPPFSRSSCLMTVLWVVEDDTSIRTGLERAFASDGYDVATAMNIAEADALTTPPDVVLLDANLPDGDGFDLCRILVARFPSTRVVMLTARSAEFDIVAGLDCGAADYVTKPFRLAELKARVRAQLRTASPPTSSDRPELLEVGDVRLDLDSRRAWLGEAQLDLRAKEFDLLARFLRDPGKVLTRDVLMRDVWDEHWFGSTKTLDVHVATLRRRFGERPGERTRIDTVRGVGFRFEAFVGTE